MDFRLPKSYGYQNTGAFRSLLTILAQGSIMALHSTPPSMPRLFTILFLAAVLFLSVPAQAQLRADVPSQSGTAAVYQADTGFSLRSLINPDHFKIGQSYEMSFSSFGGQSLSLGVYTTSLRYQPNDKLAARVDVGVAHSPFGSDGVQQSLGFTPESPAKVYLQNAQVAYRPTENSLISLSIQQSPFGSYASPYGYNAYDPYGRSTARMRVGSSDFNDLFWRSSAR